MQVSLPEPGKTAAHQRTYGSHRIPHQEPNKTSNHRCPAHHSPIRAEGEPSQIPESDIRLCSPLSVLRGSNIPVWGEYADPFPPFSNTPNPIYSAQTGMLLSSNADTDAEAHPGLNHLPYARRRDMNTSGPAAIAASPPVCVPTRPDSRTFETYSDLAHLPCVHQHDTMPSTATSSMPSSPAYAPTRPDSRKLKSAPVSAAPHRPGRHAMTGRCGNTP